ncbi:MAG TPA: acyl-CoA thioesterase [Mycobacteriales bacterium]
MPADPGVYRSPVRYFEVDAQGVVFNMWYLGYVDEASSWFFDRLPCARLRELDMDVQLVHADIDWSGSLRAGDTAHIAVAAERIGTTSFTLRFEVRRSADTGLSPVAVVRVVYVVVGADIASGKRPIPDELREALLRAG